MFQLTSIAEIAIISFAAYMVLRFLQGTRGAGILRGLVILFVLAFAILMFLATKLEMPILKHLLDSLLAFSLIFLVIIYQQEIRRGLISLGQNRFLRIFFKLEIGSSDEVIKSVLWLSERKIGALIAVERIVGLGNYAETGTRVDAEVSQQLMSTIFWPGSPLHDGAVIVQGSKIVAAACVLPLSENMVSRPSSGFRHRAALGITEETDAIVIVVSEETGRISVGIDGRLDRNVSREELPRRIGAYLNNGEKAE